MRHFKKGDPIVELARKNELQWIQVKAILSKTKKYSKETLMSMKPKALASLLVQVKKDAS